MKKNLLTSIAITAFATLLILSCKKKDETNPEQPAAMTTTTGGTTTGASGSFLWQENGGSVITADSSYWTTGTWGTGVRAYKGGMTNFFEINWATQNNISVGTKTLTTPYDFTFLKGSATYTCATNQTLNLTASSTATISGNLNVPVSGGSITSITATFTGIPKR